MACSSYFSDGESESLNKVVVLTPFPNATADELAEAFTAETGIQVEQILDSTTKILARLRIEKRRPRGDVWYSGGGCIPFMTAVKEDLLEAYIPPKHNDIPYKRGRLVMRDKLWRWLPLAIVSQGYCYNPQVTPYKDIPKTWDDLALPNWKGQIEMWDPADSGTSMLFLAAAIQRYKKPDGDESVGWEYLSKVFRNLKRYTREGKPAFSVARGDTRIGLHFASQYLEFLDQQKSDDQLSHVHDNIAWYLPPESPVIADAIALIKGCPHPENGRRFIDFCLSSQGQKIINRYFFSIDPTQPPPKGLDKNINLDYLLSRAEDLDLEWTAENYDRLRKHWQNKIEAAAER
ncbi:MAG: extracellular solute-binding protein [Candidatus Bruticola sp.]